MYFVWNSSNLVEDPVPIAQYITYTPSNAPVSILALPLRGRVETRKVGFERVENPRVVELETT